MSQGSAQEEEDYRQDTAQGPVLRACTDLPITPASCPLPSCSTLFLPAPAPVSSLQEVLPQAGSSTTLSSPAPPIRSLLSGHMSASPY